MARRENKTTPKVLHRTCYGADQSLAVESAAWWEWLTLGQSFYVEMQPAPGYTARCERRAGGMFWYAFKRAGGKLYKAYMGRSADLSYARLVAIAGELEAKIGG